MGEAGTEKSSRAGNLGIAGEVGLELSQEARGSESVQSELQSAQAAQTEARGNRLALCHRSSGEGRAGGDSTEALGRILLCVHYHCVSATCKELPEPGTMRHSNLDSQELHFEYNKNSQLCAMSVYSAAARA